MIDLSKYATIIVSFSGGKDSTAMLLYLTKELGLKNVKCVFADTMWEHQLTYDYVKFINDTVWPIITVRPDLGFVDLAIKKHRFPSTKARFCTTELKLKPMRKWMLQALASGEIAEPLVVCAGVRKQESPARASLDEFEAGDSFNHLPMWRPILEWTHDEVFACHKRHGIEPNPLYKLGMGRVGCMPCIMANMTELGEIARRLPDVVDKVAAAEAAGRDHSSFFAPDTIPERERERDRTWTKEETGEVYKIGSARKVFDYCKKSREERRVGQMSIFGEEEMPSCKSQYGLCE